MWLSLLCKSQLKLSMFTPMLGCSDHHISTAGVPCVFTLFFIYENNEKEIDHLIHEII